MESLDPRLALLALCTLGLPWLYLLKSRTSVISTLAGPPTPSWIFGHSLQLLLSPSYGQYEFEWQRTYGPVYRIQGCFGQERLMISDPHALGAVYNIKHFDHTPSLANVIYLVQGPLSLAYVNRKTHKRLRAALNPGFSAASVRGYQPIFEKVAHELCDGLAVQLELQDNKAANIDVLRFLETATLNAISQVVFGIPVADMGASFVSEIRDLTILVSSLSPLAILLDAAASQMHLPAWFFKAVATHLPTYTFSKLRNIRRGGTQLGMRLVRERVDALTQAAGHTGSKDSEEDHVFAQLVAAASARSTHARATMSLEEIAGQSSLMILAGQESTSNAVAFALLEFARNPTLQDDIRGEIAAKSESVFDSVDVQNTPLLEAFVKEVLRYYPGAPLTERIALCDTVLPLQTPVKAAGEILTSILVRKGQIVVASPGSYHRLERWGADADKFRPSRWLDGTVKLQDGEAVGPYANLATFIGGNRVCLGWRFAVLEMHVLLEHLIRRFRFTLPSVQGDTREIGHGRAKLAAVLIPTMPSGERGLELCIEAVI
ncbi:cytochrome P450 [Mycena amicta]|nr:cytochrome P450 [Mycena amicta]